MVKLKYLIEGEAEGEKSTEKEEEKYFFNSPPE
jgi:hypothetical protein